MSETKPLPFQPFADAAAVQTIGALSLENGPDRIAVHGSVDLTRDRTGLERARALQVAVNAIVAALAEADLPEDDLPENVAGTTTVRNPFA